ncbi:MULTISPECIES: arylsulfatase [Zobellia]|uniref:arylsulfatase n=1 Tax=Zobellia TaxID=112040 RepID=UPI000B5361C3|nr:MULTISPECIES: arylsulfatase [Zobellia]MBU3026136.1 arylsulfatase [Zobellia galactanivorans]OWW27221.1 arylsulfatase [Zobellia sp. OII3]
MRLRFVPNLSILFVFSLLLSLGACKEETKTVTTTTANTQQKPNIIYILADDLGYGDLSSYGQKKFETPRIDELAQRGMKFTQHYSGAPVCAPARSSLMTGQHTGHTPIRGNMELEGEGQTPLPGNSVTIAEMLKKAGYITGAFGKWGLGFIGTEGDPVAQGFDEFYGYNCQRMSHRYYPTHLWHNEEKVLLEGNDWTKTETYAPDKIQAATLNFIETNKEKPFFAYVPFVLPHAELISPNDSIFDKFKDKYEETPYTAENSYTSDYGPDIVPQEYAPQLKPHAAFASMVYRMDVYVGQILDKLDELGIADNTIVMFTSDNGPHAEGGADPEFFNSSGGLKGIKRDLYEGGIRSPFLAVWPNKIKAGSTSDHVSAFWDLMPTLAEITNTDVPASSDGISFLPTLLGKKDQKQHEYLYWEFSIQNGRKAVRKGDWKGVIYNFNKQPQGPFELYNLADDPEETHNLADQHPEIVTEMKQIMENASEESELFPF